MATNDQVATGVRVGDLLAGKYRIDGILGAGGMGVVVAAHHVELDEKVAIKFLLAETLGNAEAVARFAREARAAVKIKSEHVAKVTDVGRLENGAPYMVMEYLEGGDLSAWLSQRGALPIEQAIEFVLQACEAIAEAHALGIVHRDLKPANLFVIRRSDAVLSVKVLDFGISKTTGMSGSGGSGSMTKTSALMGSPLYMSPEQMQSSKDVDARGDIWALGVILYELVAGRTPFTGDTMPELVLQIMTASPPRLRSFRPDAPEGLEAVISRCLDKDRGRRFQTVGELAAALLPYGPRRAKASVERINGILMAAGLAGSALVLPPSSDRTEEPPTAAGTAASWGTTTPPKSRGRVAIASGAGIALLLAMTVLALHGKGKEDGPVTEPSAAVPHVAAEPPAEKPTPIATAAPVPPSAPPASSSASAVSPKSIPVETSAEVAPAKGSDRAGKRGGKTGAPPAAAPPVVTLAAPKAAAPPPPPPPPAPPPVHPSKPTDEWGEGRL